MRLTNPVVIPAAASSSDSKQAGGASSSTFGIHVTFDQNTSTLSAGFVADVDAVVAYFQGSGAKHEPILTAAEKRCLAVR